MLTSALSGDSYGLDLINELWVHVVLLLSNCACTFNYLFQAACNQCTCVLVLITYLLICSLY